jgi:hypothetical protein
MIKRMAEAPISIWMELIIAEIGKKTSNMVMELKPGRMLQNMKVITNMGRNTVSVLSNGLMDLLTSVNFTTITYTEKEFTRGQIIENTRENGEQTKCMEKELLLGQIPESILENMQRTKRKDTESLYGQTVAVTGENG